MRLDFNILWVEDQPARVQAQKNRLDFLIRKEGFRLSAKFATSVPEAIGYLSDGIYGDHVDLILMDYDLGAGPSGSEGIVEARRKMPYKEIIFYSAQSADLRAILERSKIDGIYISNRDDLPESADGIFQMLVKKVLDIEHTRGIVMGATSDIDHCVNECLIAFFDTCDAPNREKIWASVADRLAEIRSRFEKDATEIQKAEHITELIAKSGTYTSFDRLNLLREILKLLNIHLDKANALNAYVYKIIPKRNELAHVRVCTDGFSRKLKDKKGQEITIEDMRKLRIDLLESRELFEAIYGGLPQIPQTSRPNKK